jgi:hypothetical protein
MEACAGNKEAAGEAEKKTETGNSTAMISTGIPRFYQKKCWKALLFLLSGRLFGSGFFGSRFLSGAFALGGALAGGFLHCRFFSRLYGLFCCCHYFLLILGLGGFN